VSALWQLSLALTLLYGLLLRTNVATEDGYNKVCLSLQVEVEEEWPHCRTAMRRRGIALPYSAFAKLCYVRPPGARPWQCVHSIALWWGCLPSQAAFGGLVASGEILVPALVIFSTFHSMWMVSVQVCALPRVVACSARVAGCGCCCVLGDPLVGPMRVRGPLPTASLPPHTPPPAFKDM
jgi:hypothetical protein